MRSANYAVTDEEPYELVVTPPARRALTDQLPEPVAAAVIDFLTTAPKIPILASETSEPGGESTSSTVTLRLRPRSRCLRW